MSAGSLSRRYAKALFEIGLEDGSHSRIGQDVTSLAKAMNASDELSEVLESPAVPRGDRENIVLAILQRIGATKTTVNFCKLLLDRERMNVVPGIARELAAMIDEHEGQLTAQVTSATALTSSQQAELKSALEALSGKKIQIEVKQDPELLGGVVAKVGDLVYDGSLRTQLRELRRNLAN